MNLETEIKIDNLKNIKEFKEFAKNNEITKETVMYLLFQTELLYNFAFYDDGTRVSRLSTYKIGVVVKTMK